MLIGQLSGGLPCEKLHCGGAGGFAARHIGRIGIVGPAATDTGSSLMVDAAGNGAQAAFPMDSLEGIASGEAIPWGYRFAAVWAGLHGPSCYFR